MAQALQPKLLLDRHLPMSQREAARLVKLVQLANAVRCVATALARDALNA